jgi:hypothetical protein
MISRTWAGVVLLVLVSGFLGCHKDKSPTAPTVASSPSATSPPPPVAGLFMKGTVSDTAYRPLAGARVEVLDGPQAGLSTTTGIRGEFSMTGVFDGATRFRATEEGHITATRTLQPFCARCNPNWWINFTLEVPDPPVNISGDYTLTFVANSTCTMLPDQVRSRTFTGTIPETPTGVPADAYFRVGGATFFEDWDGIGIGVAGDYVAFWLETLVEQIAPNTFVAFSGQAAASIGRSSMSTFALPFNGSIEYCVTTAENGRYHDCLQGRAATRRCDSTHQLILTRR